MIQIYRKFISYTIQIIISFAGNKIIPHQAGSGASKICRMHKIEAVTSNDNKIIMFFAGNKIIMLGNMNLNIWILELSSRMDVKHLIGQ